MASPAGQIDTLRAAAGVVGDAENSRALSGAHGDKDYDNGAVSVGGDRITAVIILNEVCGIRARDGEARNFQGRGAGVGQRDGLRQT